MIVGLISSNSLITYRIIYIPLFKSGTDGRISLLREQINPTNKPELNCTFQIQIVVVAIRSVAQDLEKVETTIALKKAKLKNSKDIQEIDRLLAELEALEWLQDQIAVFSHGDNNEAVLG